MINLWLDDVRDPPSDGREWTVCRTFEEAKAALMTGSVAFASLDHDLGLIETSPGVWSEQTAPTGYDLVKWMAEHKVWPASKPVVHSANPVGAGAMRQAIDRYWRPNPRTFLVRYADGTEERVSAAQVATGRGGR